MYDYLISKIQSYKKSVNKYGLCRRYNMLTIRSTIEYCKGQRTYPQGGCANCPFFIEEIKNDKH